MGNNKTFPLLRISDLSCSFGGIRALDSLSFDVAAGGITGMIGQNGAGKTTVFNLITGVYRPSCGQILLDGKDITGMRPDAIVRTGVTRTFQNIRLFGSMTSLENVMIPLTQYMSYGLGGALFRLPGARLEEKNARKKALELLDVIGIADSAFKKASELPYGTARKLEIARALACSPKLLLLDEPAAGMNESETSALADTITKVQRLSGLAILLIEHHISLVMDICSYIVVAERGRVLASGVPDEIKNDQAVINSYLGRRKAR